MAEDVLHAHRIDGADEQRAGRVAQVVEAERRQLERLTKADIAPTHRRRVGVITDSVDEHVVVGLCEVSAPRQQLESR